MYLNFYSISMKQHSITKGSPDRFGFEWSTYRKILPIYEEQFRRWTPFFQPADWKNKTFLEVRELMSSVGLKNIQLRHVNDMSWAAMGEK